MLAENASLLDREVVLDSYIKARDDANLFLRTEANLKRIYATSVGFDGERKRLR